MGRMSSKKKKIVAFSIILFLLPVSFFLVFRGQIPVFFPHQEKIFYITTSKNNVEPDITVAKNNSNISVKIYYKEDTKTSYDFYGNEKQHTFLAGSGVKYKIVAKNDSNSVIFAYVNIWDND